MKKTNIRTCVITRQKYYKTNLIRFIIDNNKIFLDIDQNKPGRGYYLIKNIELIKSEKTKQILMRKFKASNINEFISSLE